MPDLPIAVAWHGEIAVASVTHAAIEITDWTPGRDGSLIANPPGLPARRYHVHAS